MTRLKVGGILGVTPGMEWNPAPAFNDIDGDNDGVFNPAYSFTLDLSHLASRALGQQCSMMGVYKLHRIRIGVRPVDDANDNEEASNFGGRFLFHHATDHTIEALKLARATEKAVESTQLDSDSFLLSIDKDYTGFRYNWSYTPDYHTTAHATSSNVDNMDDFWNLSQIGSAYNAMTEPDESNALFNGRWSGEGQALFNMGWSNTPFAGGSAGEGGAEHVGDDTVSFNVDVLPLIHGQILYSHVNEPGTVDDDYIVVIDCEFTMGRTF